MSRCRFVLAATILIASASTSVLSSQSIVLSSDDRWQAWHGCWHAEGAPGEELLCIVPNADGVKLLTISGDKIVAESGIKTDGRARNIQVPDCTGTETAYWSADSRRVFLSSDLSCDGSHSRKVRGMFVFVNSDEWLSVQSLSDGDQTSTRVVRYSAVSNADLPAAVTRAIQGNSSNRRAARIALADNVSSAAVKEATNYLGEEAVQAWIPTNDVHTTSASVQIGRLYEQTQNVRVVEEPTTYVRHTYVVDDYYYTRRYAPWGYYYPHPLAFGINIGIRNPIYVYGGPTIFRYTSSNHGGYHNSGNYNSGHFNTSNHNGGNHNGGNHDSGNFNGGGYNSGGYNSGGYYSGTHNSGTHSSGHDRGSSSSNSISHQSGSVRGGSVDGGGISHAHHR